MAFAADAIDFHIGDEQDLRMPRSPGADYGLTSDFDPAKYNFYNPNLDGERAACPRAQLVVAGSKHRKYDYEVSDHPLEETPETLSTIEEQEDDESSAQVVLHNEVDTTRTFSQGNGVREAAKTKTEDQWQPSLEESHGNPSTLESRLDILFSRRHLQAIFSDRELALIFKTFLLKYRPQSVPILTYYLDIVKALRALRYAESIVNSLEPVAGHPFTTEISSATMAWILEDKADRALDLLLQEDLPPFIAYNYMRTINLDLVKRVTGRQDPISQAFAGGLAEAFVLSDPTSPDNPIIFSSEGFHTLTGYRRKDILGRNCRVLGGKNTSRGAIKRFKSALNAEREHFEVLLNYRHDGSSFINLVICIPLRDQSESLRYYLGAHLDITECVLDYTGFNSLRKVLEREERHSCTTSSSDRASDTSFVDRFTDLTEFFSAHELEKSLPLRRRESASLTIASVHAEDIGTSASNKPEILAGGVATALGVYRSFLVARPHPSLRILFACPQLRSTGILQQPFMNSIGGSYGLRRDLDHAFESGRKVTAKVQWLSPLSNPVNCWVHCTPLLNANGNVAVWMIVLVDDQATQGALRDPMTVPHTRTAVATSRKKAADLFPWDTQSKRMTAGDVSTNTRRENKVLPETESIVGAEMMRDGHLRGKNDRPPHELKAKTDPGIRDGGASPTTIEIGRRPIAIREVPLDEGPHSRQQIDIANRSAREATSHGNGSRPLPAETSKAPIQTHLQPTVKIAGLSSNVSRGEKPAPIHLPKPTSSFTDDDPEGLRPFRKRTYKSLSPYGIIFDE